MFDILHNYWELLLLGQYPHGALGGLAITLILSLLGLGLAFPVSILLALARISPMAVFRVPATMLVYTIRGIPLIIAWNNNCNPLKGFPGSPGSPDRFRSGALT